MVFKILQIFLNCKPQRHWPDDQHCPVSSDTDPSASLRAHASCPCPNGVPWGLWGSANPVLVLTKFCTTYPLARIRAWTFQPLEQNFLNWQLQNCGVFLHWSFANAISSMFCMYDLINPWTIKKKNKNKTTIWSNNPTSKYIFPQIKSICFKNLWNIILKASENPAICNNTSEPRGHYEWMNVWNTHTPGNKN